MSRGFASSPRVAMLAGGVFLSFAGLGWQLINLHVFRRDELIRYVEKSRNRIYIDTARRGDILDSHGGILATSRTQLVVWADPQLIRPQDEALWPAVAGLLDVPIADLRRILGTKLRVPAPSEDDSGEQVPQPIRWAKIKEGVEPATFDRITALGVKGIYSDRVYSRVYPHNQLAAHVIGFVNKAETPVTGIEYFADFFLRGRNGWTEGEHDARGRELAQFQKLKVPATDGFSVKLSLDSTIQSWVEDELRAISQKYGPKKATIIVSDARTGFLLGLGNFPTFDPNAYGRYDDEARRNVALADIYEPGSVFKIVAASGALEDNLVTPETVFDCSITSILYNGRLRDLPDEDHPFGKLTVAEILAHSSNRGADQLAMKLGDDRYYSYVRAFGFGSSTGFPVGGEVPGILAAPANWDGKTITRMPMGHSVAVTVMQMHQAMSVIAAGGAMLKPQVISEIRDADGIPVYQYGPQKVRQVISTRTAKTMARLLMGVASNQGTAPEAAIPLYQVAGKTGTTQKLIDGQYSKTHHVASFVGFFPASDPRIVISVIVDDADAHAPGGIAYGAKIAAPAFKHLSELLISYLDIKPVLDGPSFAQIGGQPSFVPRSGTSEGMP